jgi:hypothetical protein
MTTCLTTLGGQFGSGSLALSLLNCKPNADQEVPHMSKRSLPLGLFGSLTLALLIGACGGSTGSTGSPGTAGSTGSAGTTSTGAGGTAGATSTAGTSGAGGGAGAGTTGSAGIGGNSGGSAGTAGAGAAGAGGGGTGGGGAGGTTATCTNACTNAATQCESGTNLQTCGVAGSGCTAFVASTCSTGLLCERLAPAACADPDWAEWPMPNGPVDVAAGAPNTETYTDNGDGTVTDTVTRLMWQKAVAAGIFTQPQAVAFCPTLTLATHSDWRLPTIIELTSIVDLGQSSPSINVTFFPTPPAAAFWSSSPVAGSPSLAWGVFFYYGDTLGDDMSLSYDVRCVR